jgi:hypothetical protein
MARFQLPTAEGRGFNRQDVTSAKLQENAKLQSEWLRRRLNGASSTRSQSVSRSLAPRQFGVPCSPGGSISLSFGALRRLGG